VAISRKLKDDLIRYFFLLTAMVSIISLTLIMVYLFREGMPILKKTGITDFLFGNLWYPTFDPPEFGIFPLIVASVAVTLFSSAIAIPLGVMTAVYLAEIAGPKTRGIVKPLVELLAALPSVVIGFFGMVVVAPFLQETFDLPTGLNLFNAGLMLAFMSVPTICSVSEDAIYAVPRELKEASLALGATHWETIRRVILPAATPYILAGARIGIGTAFIVVIVSEMIAVNDGLGYRILDPERTSVRFNSEWLAGLSFADVIQLTRMLTVAQMLARDDFSKR